jgi:hypothetical protein
MVFYVPVFFDVLMDAIEMEQPLNGGDTNESSVGRDSGIDGDRM